MKSVRLILFALFTYLLIAQFVVCARGLKLGADGRADFRQLYTAGSMVRSGGGANLYNYELEEQLQISIVGPGMTLPFDHLAYEALLFVPFSMLKYSAAYFVFAGFNVLLLVAGQRLFRPYLSALESHGKFVPEAVFFCFLPAAITIILGQDSILLLALMVVAFLAMEKGHDARSGFLLSLGFFKFQFILPIVLLFLLWRRWRFVSGAALGGFAVIALSTWVAGFSGMRAFARTMVEMSVGLSSTAQRLKFATFPNAMPNLRGFIDTVGGSHLSAGAIQAAVIVSTLLVIMFASRMRPSLPLAVLVAVLVSYHGLIHDSTLLALPLGMVLVRSVSEKNLLLGIFDLLLFACPAVMFEFFGGRYFPMAIPILVLLFLQRSAPREAVLPLCSE
jgi:hypothetical protein